MNTAGLRQRVKTSLQQKKKPSSVDDVIEPPLAKRCDNDDANSIESDSYERLRDWSKRFQSLSIIDAKVVYLSGLFIFALAVFWPPLILLVTYILSKLLPYCLRENDCPVRRRELFEEFSNSVDLPDRFKNVHEYVNFSDGYWTNSRGMALYHSVMRPKGDTVAVVCFCHGYADHSSYAKRMAYQRLVDQGIAVVSIEYEGHGRSDGPLGLISCWETMIDDVSGFFYEKTREFDVPIFLMGESMGGAVSYCVYNRMPEIFRGVVFVAPMCKISPEMLPPPFVVDTIRAVIGKAGEVGTLGYLPIAPAKNSLDDVVNKCKIKSAQNSRCPIVYDRNPRLATARELIDITQRISENLSEFSASFLVLHGTADRVTDPALSQALYEESQSKDKTIKLYDDMWHGLTAGEPDENIEIVFADVISWILKRV